MTKPILTVDNAKFSIHRFSSTAAVPAELFAANFYSITRTPEELSVICYADIQLKSENCESDWSMLKVLGPLDFSLTGILSDIADCLAQAKVSIFALSTFDTDYILVKSSSLKLAVTSLQENGYKIQ